VISARQKSIEHTDSFLTDLSTAPWAVAAKMSAKELYSSEIDVGKLTRFARALQKAEGSPHTTLHRSSRT
jgi:hypothetical protein